MRPVLLLALAACAARAPAPPSARGEVTFRQLAEGVWAHTSHQEVPPWGRVVSHGLVVVDGATSVLVDTAWTDAQTEAILAWAADDLGRPITRAVATHAHTDKMGGMGALRAHGVATWAHPASNAAAPSAGVRPAEHDLRLDADGLSSDLAPLVVFFPGGAHTRDNVVVGVPGADLLFGGCLVRPAGAVDLGNTADADVPHWADAARAVAARFPEATVVVPSHGPPGGRELLDLTVRLAEEAAAP